MNSSSIDITNQYKRAYNSDKFYLEYNNQSNKNEEYEKIVERIHLEKYAIDNNIQYNILIKNANLDVDKQSKKITDLVETLIARKQF